MNQFPVIGPTTQPLPENHDSAYVIKAMDDQGRERSLTLLYHFEDNWFGRGGCLHHETFTPMLFRLINADPTVMAYQGASFRRQSNGLYMRGEVTYPSVRCGATFREPANY